MKRIAVDEVWRQLVALVVDTRDDWRRRASEATGLPFGRVRALRRLAPAPRTLSELANLLGSDAPATTVLVNDLVRRGLVVRAPHPTNRRAKLVSLTYAGRRLVAATHRLVEHAPPPFAALAPDDVKTLARLVATVARAPGAG